MIFSKSNNPKVKAPRKRKTRSRILDVKSANKSDKNAKKLRRRNIEKKGNYHVCPRLAPGEQIH